MKSVLITGAGGFIGSHLAEKCVELGYKVIAFIRYNSRNHWGWLEESKYKRDMQIIPGNIQEFDSVFSAMKDVNTVFHLAALIGIPYSYISPLAYIRTNIEGTYNILESAKTLETPNVLVTSTSETYGTAQYVPINETHPVVGQSPYAATKISADQLALSYYLSFHLPVKIVRPFNTYGPRQSARAIIPTVISQIMDGWKRIKIGNVYPTRDLTYVKDTVNGFLEIEKSKDLYGEVINVGMMTEISMRDLVVKISDLMGEKIELETDEQRIRTEKSEVERLLCDNLKITNHTNWRPVYNLNSGLEETIDWFKDNFKLYKSDLYNI